MRATSSAELHRIAVNPHRDLWLQALGRLTSDADQATPAGLAETHLVEPGRELIAEGQVLDNPRLMMEGWAACQRTLSDGRRRQICGFILPGDVFGLSGRPHGRAPYSVVALTKVILAPLKELRETMFREPDSTTGKLAWAVVAREQAGLVDQVVRLGTLLARERLAHLLLEFHERLTHAGLVEEDGFAMPVTQQVLADALGLSVVHINRILQSLRQEQLIAIRSGYMRLVALDRLKEIAGL